MGAATPCRRAAPAEGHRADRRRPPGHEDRAREEVAQAEEAPTPLAIPTGPCRNEDVVVKPKVARPPTPAASSTSG